MSDQTTFGLLIAAAGAVGGYALKYYHDLQIEKARAEIKLLSDQIQYLYGPLYALCSSNEAAWNTFVSKYASNRVAFFSKECPPSPTELDAWRRWTTDVFMPLNRAIVELIIKNTHLIEGAKFPDCFSAIVSHVKPYEIVLARWSQGDFSEHTAFSNYPTELNAYVSETFAQLKQRQTKLLHRLRI
ncbi:MAG TPA: hypothetical protein VIU42_02100 [Xanthobacteraceae bacterium]|jgi:hypothetical protein